MGRMEGAFQLATDGPQIKFPSPSPPPAKSVLLFKNWNGDMAFLSFYHHKHVFAKAFSLTCIILKAIIQSA